MNSEASVWAQAVADGRDVRWNIVCDDDMGVIASISVDGQVVYTAGVPRRLEWYP